MWGVGWGVGREHTLCLDGERGRFWLFVNFFPLPQYKYSRSVANNTEEPGDVGDSERFKSPGN